MSKLQKEPFIPIEKVKPTARKDDWMNKIYSLVRKIPKGKVTSYGIIADAIGARLTARMVGWAMNSAHHVTPSIPAHRVVNRNGLLTGRHHFSTPTLMQELLEAEGIKIKDHQVQNYKDHFWQPC
jgi:methylated-DNA-protein-cysteine methyltransferase related protein